jgi:hypothetical protein
MPLPMPRQPPVTRACFPFMQSPLSHVVIDDGRRDLERSRQQFDVITIDPPPPLEAAASSLLYSEEFYRVAGRRLRPEESCSRGCRPPATTIPRWSPLDAYAHPQPNMSFV